MTGFSADWLALREPADRAARDAGLVARVAGFLANRADPTIVDLGAGTGATLRALAPRLGPAQTWVLVEADPALVAAGRAALAAWGAAEGLAVAEADGGLVLAGNGRRIAVRWRIADLAADPLPVAGPIDLVTASALIDLVSADFVQRLATAAAARGAAVYSALDVDGGDDWTPSHPADAAIAAAFRADQGRDKGFGSALGPVGHATLAAALASAGYDVAVAESPWRLGRGEAALVAALAEGWAAVAAAHGVDKAKVAGWLADRRAAGCVIGHRDLLALPPG